MFSWTVVDLVSLGKASFGEWSIDFKTTKFNDVYMFMYALRNKALDSKPLDVTLNFIILSTGIKINSNHFCFNFLVDKHFVYVNYRLLKLLNFA